jgi:hypothetical protein
MVTQVQAAVGSRDCLMGATAAANVSVALCTFNGAVYLKEQLDSLFRQTVCPTELVLSDDDSSDASASIVTESANAAGMRLIVAPAHTRLGVVQNFNLALSLCSQQYVALSDQDDVWLPDKLALTITAMHEGEARFGMDHPLLVHTGVKVVSADLSPASASPMRYERLYYPSPDDVLTILPTQNFVTGCTMLVNRPLLECALPIPREALVHDWWLALVAANCGHVLYVDRPTIMHRQHGSNAMGMQTGTMAASLKRILAHPVSRLKHGMATCGSYACQLGALESRLTACHAPAAARERVRCVREAIACGRVKSVGRLLRQHVRQRTPYGTTAFYLLCLLKGSDSSS